MDVCLLWTGMTLAEQISRFCIAQRQNAVLGMRKKSDFRIPSLGTESISRGDESL